MAIPFTKYINIVSGVASSGQLADRQLIGRMFSTNPLIPPQLVNLSDFTTLDSVGAYFGTNSTEYARAVQYFGWISKNITSANALSFARWVDAAVAPRIYGSVKVQSLQTWQAVSSGSFSMTIGGVTNSFTAIDFSSATSLSDVAGILQTTIRTGTGTQWTGATVTWDTSRGTGSFDFVGGATGAAVISVHEGVAGTPIANMIGWLTGNSLIICDGAAAQQPVDAVTASAALSNNFGSFLFLPTLTIDQISAVAAWNFAQNVMFQYYVPVSSSNASSWSAALITSGGTGLILDPGNESSGEYPEQMPMQVLAATDYSHQNSVQNYEFQQFPGITPSVSDGTLSNTYDVLRVNYYGQTQEAGQAVNFFQPGVLMGDSTSPIDMNTYANEQWLKSAMGIAIMNLLRSVGEVPANNQGIIQVLTIMQSVVNRALFNGTISVGKTLTTQQILYINQISGDPNAWQQVQTIGYWMNAAIASSVDLSGRTSYSVNYILIYGKDDAIRQVNGQQILT